MSSNRDLGKLTPIPSVAGQFVWNQATTSWQQVTKTMVGLPLVDNTADSTKPVSMPQQTAFDLKANLANPVFSGGVISVLAQNAFSAQAPLGNPQTGFSLTIPMASTDQKTFEWLASSQGSARMSLRTINEAYSAGTEFFVAYRAATSHLMDRLSIKGLNLVVGQDAQINSNYRIQSAGGISTTGPLLIGIFTLTTLPSAVAYSGSYITVSNATGGAKLCYSNATNWLIANTTTTVS